MTFSYALQDARILQRRCQSFSPPATLYIEGDRFVKEADLDPSKPLVSIDLDGRWVIPGLIDLHAHVTLNPRGHCKLPPLEGTLDVQTIAVMNLTDALFRGICLIRDVGAHPSALDDLLQLARTCGSELPEIVSCGSPLCVPDGHGTSFGHTVASDIDLKELLDHYLALGIRVIKLMNGPELWDEEALSRVVRLASARGIGVVVHAFTPEGVDMSILPGVSSIEHAFPFDSHQAFRACNYNIMFVPTLYCSVCSLRPEYVLTERPAEIGHLEAWRDYLADCCEREMWRGMLLGIGTDAGCAPSSFAEYGQELAALVRIGVPPSLVLRAATEDAALLLQVEDRLGIIRPGFTANCVVLDNDPLVDISTVLTPSAVFYKGRDILHRFGATASLTTLGSA